MRIVLFLLVTTTAFAQSPSRTVEPSKYLPTAPRKTGTAGGQAISQTPASLTHTAADATTITPTTPTAPQQVQPGTATVTPPPGAAPAQVGSNLWNRTTVAPQPSPWAPSPAANPWEKKPGTTPWK